MSQTKAKPKVTRLRRRLKASGISQVALAAAAGVSPVHVCNVLAGRDTSRKILEVAERLIEEAASAAA